MRTYHVSFACVDASNKCIDCISTLERSETGREYGWIGLLCVQRNSFIVALFRHPKAFNGIYTMIVAIHSEFITGARTRVCMRVCELGVSDEIVESGPGHVHLPVRSDGNGIPKTKK